jgi:hypothetical protein
VAAVPAAVLGAAALVGFVATEVRLQRRSSNGSRGTARASRPPMMPPRLFASVDFSVINAVTFLAYAGLTGVFFFFVLYLQVVAGFSALAAGAAGTPVTLLLLLGSSRSGALGTRFGPRIPLTLGCLAAAAGTLLMLRIGPGAVYWRDVLPAVVVFGLGLTAFVAPLTASVLAAVENRFAGVASGVNNAVARTGGLLAVAALPVLAGLSGGDYADASALRHGYRIAVLCCAGLFVAGGALAGVLLRARRGGEDDASSAGTSDREESPISR